MGFSNVLNPFLNFSFVRKMQEAAQTGLMYETLDVLVYIIYVQKCI